MNLDYIYASIPLPIRSKLKRIMMGALKSKLKKFYSQFIKPGELIFDIGANDGDYAEVFRELGGNIICVEPHPEYTAKLKQKFAKDKNINILAKGVGEKVGEFDFHISTFNSPNSSFSTDFLKKSRYSYRKWDKIIKVEMTTLNEMIKKYGIPHFCKIDVEGYEWEVLSTLKKPLPVISFEFLSELNEKTFKIIRHLDTLGEVKYNLCLGMQYKYKAKHWIDGEELISLLSAKEAQTWNGDIYAKFAL